MRTLSRMELAALKRMEKSLLPLEKQLAVFNRKINTLVVEKEKVQHQFNKMVEVMDAYTGGVSFREILHPDSDPIADAGEEVQKTELVDEEAILAEVEAEYEASSPTEQEPWV